MRPAQGHMKETIRKVAIDLFHKKGYFATAMSHIAIGSGIRKASIYHHYTRKEDILMEILETTMADLTESLNSYLYGVTEIEGRIRAAVRSHVKFHCDRQKEVLIADSELRGLTAKNYKSIVRRRDVYERIFQEMIRDGMEQGRFVRKNVKVLSYAVLTMCTAVAHWYNPDGSLSREEIIPIYEDAVVGMLTGNSGDVSTTG